MPDANFLGSGRRRRASRTNEGLGLNLTEGSAAPNPARSIAGIRPPRRKSDGLLNGQLTIAVSRLIDAVFDDQRPVSCMV